MSIDRRTFLQGAGALAGVLVQSPARREVSAASVANANPPRALASQRLAATSIFNVVENGATGDGTSDDTAAIQGTIVKAEAVHGTVLFPPGTYQITSALTVAKGCTLVGSTG